MSFPTVSLSVSTCATCGAKVNPRWAACLACQTTLTSRAEPDHKEQPAAPATKAPEPQPEPAPDVAAVLGMPLPEFGAKHLALRIKLPDGSQCHFVSGPREVAILRKEGTERGMIWTARELADVLGAGWTRETIGRLIAVKRTFDGVVGGRVDQPAR